MTIQEYYNVEEVANILHMSHWRVRHLVATRRLAHSRPSGPRGQIRVSREDLEAFLKRNRVAADGEQNTGEAMPEEIQIT